MAFTKTQVKFHQPVDPSDPGFVIRGMKLRWLSGYVQSRKPWRQWKTLKVSEMPKCEDFDNWKDAHPHVIDGDKIRRGDQTLAYCPIDVAKKKQKENREQQKTNESRNRSKLKDAVTGMVATGEEDND